MNKINMRKLGFSDAFSAEAQLYPNLYIGRVSSQSKDLYKVLSEEVELIAEVSGKFRYETKIQSDYPAVGDFVMIDRKSDIEGNGIIHAVLKRKSAFIRKMAGTSNQEQIVAANIDTIFLCMSLNNDFNLRRLERYLAIAWESGAVPVIILTKSDLCDDIEDKLYSIDKIAVGVDILVTSSMNGDGDQAVKAYMKAGKTIAFIGSSGVGKSTLINRLIGEEHFATRGLRNDDKGRHTTTRRELLLLPDGGIVIDTPGMRELGLESADLSQTFIDIEELASLCKFGNCTHTNEPKCAVQGAIADGSISEERLISYQKLKKEMNYDGLNAKEIEAVKINQMFGSKANLKSLKKAVKEKK